MGRPALGSAAQQVNVVPPDRAGRLARLVLSAGLIGTACGAVGLVWEKEHSHDTPRSALDIESPKHSEAQAQGSEGGHAVNSSADAGCCA